MELTLSEKAINWFKNEMGLTKGDTLKFFAKIYGSSPVQESYSLGFAKDFPIDIIASKEVDGIIFYVEESDLWFFNGHDLYVDYNETKDELEFKYDKPNH
jgi:uncharacterized protein YneR